MSIRLRLACCYGGLFAIVLLMIGALAYALHAHGLYDDLDRALVTSAGHTAAEVATSQTDPDLIEGHGGFEVILALYTSDGALRKSSAETGALPAFDLRATLRTPAGPAYDPLAALISISMTPATQPAGGEFAMLTTPEQRWRLYALPVRKSGALSGYVVAMTPLGEADSSVRTFGAMLLALGAGGLVVAVLGSWIVSSRALRPVAHMGEAAAAIARSRNFSQRIVTPPRLDELGGLAATLNEMLQSLETAYTAQQRFVADASHELRAPLTAIQANLELLQRHPDMSASDHDEALAEAARESARLTRLVADLLALARADAGVPLRRSLVDLDAVTLDVFRSTRQLARGQTLALDPFEPIQVSGDEDRLRQLLLILLDNALKYTPVGGVVTLGLRRDGDEAEIIVRDTGVGIPEPDLPHVVERFYRADPARGRDPGGTGLGLPIADWIVRQHGGRLELTSAVGAGTAVTAYLPAAGACGTSSVVSGATAVARG